MATGIYVRQSIDKKDSLSIEGQINLCKKECGDDEHFLIYKDKGFSGKNTDRPAFRQMMQDVSAGKIQKVIVYRLDRLSRSIVDFGQMWEKLDSFGVGFISVSEKFDTSTPMGRAMLYIIMVFAQLERETISERIRDNYYERTKHGTWLGGPAPYGFDNGKLVTESGKKVTTLIPNDRIEVVRRIFDEYVKEGATLGSVAKLLSTEGIPSAKRATWDNVSIGRILHSPVYVKADVNVYAFYRNQGITHFSNEIEEFDGSLSAQVVGRRKASDRKYTDLTNHTLALTNFEGVISSEQWLLCQEKLNRNRQLNNSGKGKYSWLTGFLKCQECGYSVIVKKGYHDKLNLACSGRYNMHICNTDKYEMNICEIEMQIQEELECLLEECASQVREEAAIGIREANRKLELTKIDEKIQRLLSCISESSEITVSYLNKEIEKLDNEKHTILAEISQKHTKIKLENQKIIFMELSMEEKRMVVDTFIDKVVVGRNEIEIVWKV